MGSWGTALYSDDLASDLRREFRDLVAGGLPPDSALDKLTTDYAASLIDPDEAPVFWLAVAYTAWRLGRPVPRATSEALRVITSGDDLRRWDDAKARQKRLAVLEHVATDLRSAAPPAKRLTVPFVAKNDWTTGEVVAFRLSSGLWTLFRVIGHHVDKGGRQAVCEPLDWLGPNPPNSPTIGNRPLRAAIEPWDVSQFLLGEPRRKQDVARFARTGVHSVPTQRPGRFMVLVFPHVDRQLRELFDLS
jgi:hypothetical protein